MAVRWTVKTATEQGDPVAANQVPSLAPRLTSKGVSFFLYFEISEEKIA